VKECEGNSVSVKGNQECLRETAVEILKFLLLFPYIFNNKNPQLSNQLWKPVFSFTSLHDCYKIKIFNYPRLLGKPHFEG